MKILIYDSSKGFSRFLKLNLSEEHRLFICTNKKKLHRYYDEDFDCAFINFNDSDDLKDLFLIFYQVNKIFVSTNLKDIKEKILENNSIHLLELDVKKSVLLNTIKSNLDSINKYSLSK